MDYYRKTACLICSIFTCLVPGVRAAVDDTLIGIIAASVLLFIFAMVAIGFTVCYCQSMCMKKNDRRRKHMRRLPEEYSTVSTVAAEYSSYRYPVQGHWYYSDSHYYEQPKELANYRPKVLSGEEENESSVPEVEPEDTAREEYEVREVKTVNGHVIHGINRKVIKKSQKRLSDWLNSGYDENMLSMDIGHEDDDNKRESLTAEQFLAQNVRTGSSYKDDGEYTIVDYVDNDNRRRKSSTAPHMYERQPGPAPPSSMPYVYKTTIGVVQDKPGNRLASDDDAVFQPSTSFPYHTHQEGTTVFNPILSSDSFEDTHHHRQRDAQAGAVSNLPPQERDNYREFMTS